MTVADAQERISAHEFMEWLAFYRIEPWGEFRADLRSGIAACGVASMWASSSGPRLRPKDFMPMFQEEPRTYLDEATLEASLRSVGFKEVTNGIL